MIVYYDSAVQTTFVELVKVISGSRNAMRRKGKMQAKMMEMRAAAQETDDDDGDNYDEGVDVEHSTGKLIAL